MKATVLIDNLTKDALKKEWGLAIYIEYGERRILLDTGASGAFAENAAALGFSLAKVDAGVLSHAHFDHSDGLADFFAQNETAPFYLRKGAGENCYGKKWIFHRYIGIKRGVLDRFQDRIRFVDGNAEIFPGVFLIPHTTPGLEEIGRKAGMYVRREGLWCPDCFDHEQSLVLDTEKGLVIFNSCSHGGADHIIRQIGEVFPGKKMFALIGGFHLYQSPEREVLRLAEEIKATGIEEIYTGHCTGEKAFDVLHQVLGDKAHQIYTGMEIEI